MENKYKIDTTNQQPAIFKFLEKTLPKCAETI